MTRHAFLEQLRAHLRGLPPQATNDIVADYDAHFAEGLAAGRTEAQIAEAMGDPVRLAREHRAEAGIKRWEEKRSPASALGAVFALLGLGAIDFLILLPIVGPALIVILVVYLVVVVGLFLGIGLLVGGLFSLDLIGVLIGAGTFAGAVSWGALHTLICLGLTNAAVWYARLHMKVVKPVTAVGEN